ncbi:MAG: GNAT family N-acetyltransferase [Promethearchaeota archaeon]
MANKTVEIKNGKKFILRHIKLSDLDCIWSNFNQVIDESIYLPVFEKVLTRFEKNAWYNDLKVSGNLCLVAEDPDIEPPNNVVCQCVIEDSQWEASSHVGILGVIVRKKYRNIGLGFDLIKYTLSEAKKHGKKKIILSTFATNTSAITLYKKIGFKKVGIRKKHFYMKNKYINELLMEIWIGNMD